MLAGLFSLDAFGGGFVVQSLIALWLYQRFGLSPAMTGTHILSDLGADGAVLSGGGAHRAARFGLINKIVFTRAAP